MPASSTCPAQCISEQLSILTLCLLMRRTTSQSKLAFQSCSLCVLSSFLLFSVGFKLVPIVGVDYRGKSVILAWAFVLYEDQISYEWLLEQFLSVVPHPPRTVVSDREQALISAVRSKCPTVCFLADKCRTLRPHIFFLDCVFRLLTFFAFGMSC